MADQLRDGLETLVNAFLITLGTGTPEEQMAYSAALAVIAYVSSTVSLGATILAGLFFTLTFMIGLVRYLYAWATS